MSKRPIDNRPRREITGPSFDAVEEKRLVRNRAMDLGYSEEAGRIADEAAERLEYNPDNGEALWVIFGEQRASGPTGREALVQRIHERISLLKHGPDPREALATGLKVRGYTKAEIDERLLRVGLRRLKDGRVEYRGQAAGDWIIAEATRQIAQEIEKNRAAAAVDPEVEAEVASRGFRV